MTIELSLRKRATWLRMVAFALFLTAVGLLIVAAISLPRATSLTVRLLNDTLPAPDGTSIAWLDPASFYGALGVVAVGFSAIVYAVVILSRGAFAAMQTSHHASGLADALSVSGDNINQFKELVSVFSSKLDSSLSSELLTKEEREFLLGLVSKLK